MADSLIKLKGRNKKSLKSFYIPVWIDEEGFVTTMLKKAYLHRLIGVHRSKIVDLMEEHGLMVTEAEGKWKRK